MSWRRALRAAALRGPVARAPRDAEPAIGPHGHGLRADDGPLLGAARPRQGRYGDCWVLAAMLAVHEAAPERIAAMIDVSGTEAMVVLRGGARVIRTDRRLPVDAAGRWVGATAAGGGPGWAGLLEKAAAIEVAGSYRWLQRGIGRFGLELLTGDRAHTHVRVPAADRLDDWIREGHAVLASTHPLSHRIRTAAGPLPRNHVFALVGADPGTQQVQLRNPWRPDELLTLDRRTLRRGILSIDVTARPVREGTARPDGR